MQPVSLSGGIIALLRHLVHLCGEPHCKRFEFFLSILALHLGLQTPSVPGYRACNAGVVLENLSTMQRSLNIKRVYEDGQGWAEVSATLLLFHVIGLWESIHSILLGLLESICGGSSLDHGFCGLNWRNCSPTFTSCFQRHQFYQ